MRCRMLFLLALISCLSWGTPAFSDVSDGDRPRLAAKTLDGEPVELEKLRGKVVLVDFWATWCAPCEKSFEFYREMVARYGKDGFVVVAVSVDEDAGAVRKFVAKTPLPFTVVVDTDHQLAGRFAPPTMPTSYLLDRRGVVRSVHEGFRNGDAKKLEPKIKKLVSDGDPG